MSTALTSLQAEIEKELALLRHAAPPPSSNRIQIPQGTKSFKFPDNTVTSDPFNAVIIDYRWSNTLYEGMYNPNDRKPPVCQAVGTDPKTMVPGESSTKPGCASCAECPMNKFGSKGKGKACKNTVVLALVPDVFTADSPIWTLAISPTGLTPWTQYLNNLLQLHGKIPAQVVTTLGFNPREAYATVLFKIGGINENIETAFALRESARMILDRNAN